MRKLLLKSLYLWYKLLVSMMLKIDGKAGENWPRDKRKGDFESTGSALFIKGARDGRREIR
jgi:hypothetical protein